MIWMLAILLKPIGLMVLFGIAYYGKCLAFKIPESKFKQLLFLSWRI